MFLVLGAVVVAAQKLMGQHFRAEHHNEVWWMVPFLFLLGFYTIRRHGREFTESPDNAADWLLLLGSLASLAVFILRSVS